MLVGLLTTLLVIDGLFLVLFILIQKGKGNMGLGALGGGAQTLFGGSGGQDIFQKITWILGGLFMLGSFGLSILQSKITTDYIPKTRPVAPISRALPQNQAAPVSQAPAGDTESAQ